MKNKYETEEKKILKDFENGKFRRAKNAESLKQMAVEAARSYMSKDARINIRMSTSDLDSLKRKAAEEAIPYQTLITSVLHKFITGKLRSA